MTVLAIALNQVLHLFALYRPLGAQRCGLRADQRIGVGYLLSTALALFVGYALDVCGVFSSGRQFAVWAGICLLLNGAVGRGAAARGRLLRGERTAFALLALVLALSAGVRLAEPLRNASLAGGDSYGFINFYAWISHAHQAIHNYPSGFALATAMSPWPLQPYAAVRWAPHWTFLAGLVAAFGFWRQVGGLRFALLLTLLLGAAWPFYPLTAYYPLFIQWTFGFVGIPALLVLYARLARQPSTGCVLVGIVVNGVFAMTAGYFALYTNVLCLLLTLAQLPKRRAARPAALAAMLVAVAAPATLLAFYGVLVRYHFGDGVLGIFSQVQALNAVVAANLRRTGAPFAGENLVQALLRTVLHFLEPADNLRLGMRSLLYAALTVVGVWSWCLARAPRQQTARLLAGVLLFSVFSAATGIFELPAWQGRNVFVALYAGLALGLWLALHRFAARARRLLRAPWFAWPVLAVLVGPSLAYPPTIGRNVPISKYAQPRHLEVDNRIMSELTRPLGPGEARKTFALVVRSEDTPGLVGGLHRLQSHAHESAFAAYRVVPATNFLADSVGDAQLFADDATAAEGIPDGFRVHTQGAGITFVVRDPSRTP